MKSEEFFIRRKYVDISMEALERLVDGKRVEGSLRRDEWTGVITFRAYNRQPRRHSRDRLLRKLPWGWVKESIERVKVFGSFPKAECLATLSGMIDGQAREAKDALIDRELDLIEFC